MKTNKMKIIKIKIKKINMTKTNKMKINRMKVVKIINQTKNNIRYLFSFPLNFTTLDISVNNTDPEITQFAYGIFLISLVALFCFIIFLIYKLNSFKINNKK